MTEAAKEKDVYLVATNQGKLGGNGPIGIAGVEVGVAYTSDVELDEALARLEILGLLYRVGGLYFEGLVRSGDNGSLLRRRNLGVGRHRWR